MKPKSSFQNLWAEWLDALRDELEWMESSGEFSEAEISAFLELMFHVYHKAVRNENESS